MGRLTVALVRALSQPGRYGDGGTLFLRVAPGGSKGWVQRLTIGGKRRDLGLGGWPIVTLAEAREQAIENRRHVRRGGDPLADKRRAKVPTFMEASDSALEANRRRWRNAKTVDNWRATTWDEIDPEAREWRIPASRMKTGTEHRVPLSEAAAAALEAVRPLRGPSDLVFPSPSKPGRPLSDMTLTKVLRDTGLADRATVHGFRTAFRTWASERTNADHAVMELCLAHHVGTAVERAYARLDLLAKRRRLMDQWGAFVTGGASAKVVRLHHIGIRFNLLPTRSGAAPAKCCAEGGSACDVVGLAFLGGSLKAYKNAERIWGNRDPLLSYTTRPES